MGGNDVQYVLRYDTLPGKGGPLRDWIRENENALRENAAPGWHYAGTYFTVRSFGSYGVESRWDLDDYAALGAGFGDEVAVQLLQDWFEFVDQSRPMEAQLLKGAHEVDVLPGQ
ncbi:MAG: hypothetical protein QNJ88_10645 [Acidimicrobiia bacterium]|nr:hypothetical protein [Acidimicrobiia bacterium]